MARITAIAIIVTFVSPVAATDFGSDWANACDTTFASECTMDANPVPYKLYAVSAPMVTAMTWAENNVYDPTDLVVYSTTSESARKARIFDDNVGNTGYFGYTLCAPAPLATYGGNPATHTAWCKPQDTLFNNYLIDADGTVVEPLPEDEGRYRLVNSRAVLRDLNGAVGVAAWAEDEFLRELEGKSFTSVLESVKDFAGR